MNVNECWYSKVCQKYETEQCNDSCVRFLEMSHMMKYSGLPKNWFKNKPLAAVQEDLNSYKKLKDIQNNIYDFVSSGRNLYIYSENTGNGKTTWATKLLKSYFDSVWAGNGLRVRGFFIPTQAYLIDRKTTQFSQTNSNDNKLFTIIDEFGNDILTTKNIINCDLIVWDDFVIKTLSAYDYTHLFAILDQRYLNRKSNIFTSGSSLEELDSMCGSKISSRIKMNCDIIELKAGDFRASSIGGVLNG